MATTGIFHLFVYGSLRSGFHSPAYEYISRFFTFVGEGKVKGELFDMGEYPAAIPSTKEKFIVGELYSIKHEEEFSWAIGQLDDYEGLAAEEGELTLSRRDLVDVYHAEEVTRAWIYWYHGDVSGRPAIESGDLMQYMRDKK